MHPPRVESEHTRIISGRNDRRRRSYSDPDFMLPEEYDKVRWERMVRDKAAGKKIVTDPKKV